MAANEEVDQHILDRFEILQKLGKGVRAFLSPLAINPRSLLIFPLISRGVRVWKWDDWRMRIWTRSATLCPSSAPLSLHDRFWRIIVALFGGLVASNPPILHPFP